MTEMRDTLITIQENWNDADETANLFVKKRELFT